jgi:hypothetical protein
LTISGNPLITCTIPNSTGSNDIQIQSGAGKKSVTGGTFQMGTASTPAASTFFLNSDIPLDQLTLFDECSIRIISKNPVDGTIPDSASLEITAPELLTVVCNQAIPEPFTSLQAFISHGGAALHNCTLLPASFKLLEETQSGTTCPYTISRTYRIEDIFGSVGTARQQILVETEAPENQAVAETVVEPIRLKSAMGIMTTLDLTSGTYNLPAGITDLTVDLWGAGGGGSVRSGAAGGGGGGAYTQASITLIPAGSHIDVTVGTGGAPNTSTTAPGNFSRIVIGANTVNANGGLSTNSSRTGGAGGTAQAIGGVVAIAWAGGVGGNARASTTGVSNEGGGGGGGSALTTANGGAGGNATATGGTGGTGTGNGGRGADGDGVPDAAAGSSPGGGGGGRGENGTSTSKAGADGKVSATWTCPSYDMLTSAATATPVCGSGTSTVTLTSSTLPDGNYTVTYTTNPGIPGNIATMVFSGTTGTFTTMSLSATTTITVTDLGSGTSPLYCSSSISANNIATVLVNPKPMVTNSPLTKTICSGSATGLVTLTSGVTGTTYAWTATASAGVSGFTASGTNTIPVQTISTTGTTQGTVTYAITPTAAGCVGAVTNYTVLVNPKPSVTNSPLSQTICSGNFTSLVTLTSDVAGASFAWTATATAGVSGFTASGTSTIPVQTISTTGNIQGTVTYAITPTAAGCVGALSNYTVLVNPKPTITNSLLTQTSCSGNATTLVTLSSDVFGATFAWTATATPGVTGFTASGTNTIPVQTISTTGTTQGTVTYTITPTAAGCVGAVTNYTVLVNPKPTVTNSQLTQTICSGGNTSFVALTSDVTGGTFAWTASATPGVSGFNTNGTNTIPVQTISTTGTTQGTVTYTITPTAAGCIGTVTNYTVLVNPKPTVNNSSLTQTICSGGNTSLVTLTSDVAGATFAWTASATAGITGFTASGTGTMPIQTITTISATQGTITYSIIPTAAGCVGIAANYTITVNPLATVNAGPAIASFCQGQISAPLVGAVGGSALAGTWTSSVGGTFSPASGQVGHLNATWTPPVGFKGTAMLTLTTSGPCAAVSASKSSITVYEQPAIVVHPASQTDCYERTVDFNVTATGSGLTYQWMRKRPSIDPDYVNISGSDPNVDVSIPGTLKLSSVGDLTNNPDGTKYIVIVTNGHCSTESNSTILTVNKIISVANPTVDPDATAVTLCSFSNFSYTVTSNHPENIISYQWMKWSNPDNWDPIVDGGAISGTQTATLEFNNTTVNESGKYKVTIKFLSSSVSGCTATSDNFNRTLTILPAVTKPIVTGPQTICYNTQPSALTSTAGSGGRGTGYSYNWESSPDSVNWSPTIGGTSNPYQPPNLTVSTYYRVIVYDTNSMSCGSAASASIKITVEDGPIATAGGTQTVCVNKPATVSGAEAANYSAILWIHDGAGLLTNETTLTPTYTPAPPDAIVGSVTLTMYVTGSNSCSSVTTSDNYTVYVNALPVASISYPGTEYCADDGNISAIITGTPGGKYSALPEGLTINSTTGEVTTGTSTPGIYTVTYTIPASLTCEPVTASTTISIHALPLAQTGPNGNICVGESVVLGVAPIPGHTYNWTSDPAGYASFDSQITVSPLETTTYYLNETIDETGCAKSNSVTVTSNQQIVVTIDPESTTLCSGETTNINLTSNYIGTAFTWVVDSSSGVHINGYSDGSGSTIAQLLTNSGIATETIRYNINAVAGNCINTSASTEVTVYPTTIPTITAGATTICSGESVNLTSFYASAYQWKKDGNLISGATLQNYPATTTGSYTVEITDANGCKATSDATGITVNPMPTASISGTTSVCQNAASPNVTFTGSNGTAPYTFTYTINGGADQTVSTTSGNSVTVSAPTGISGVFNYYLKMVIDASSTTCSQTVSETAIVTVNSLPTAILSGNADLCQGAVASQITFTGSNGTAPYTFTYNINGGTNQTVATTSGNNVTVSVLTGVAGAFVYNLVSVADSKSCSNNASGNVTITVNPSTTAILAGTSTVCLGDTNPLITFTGSGGLAPYTFHYKINGGTDQTVTTLSGNSVTVSAPTGTAGTFTYSLISVAGTGTAVCNTSATGTATITVRPIPTATISGTTTVCEGETQPAILFTGSNGSAPYTFTYRINGGAMQTLTTSGGNTAVFFAPTNTTGTFIYSLIRVKDAGASSCTNNLVPTTATVTVKPKPTVTLTADKTIVCQNDAEPVITLSASGGTWPYTFTYSINSGPFLTVVTPALQNFVAISVPTGTSGNFVYNLTSASDANSCLVTVNQTVNVTVNPQPVAPTANDLTTCYDGIVHTGSATPGTGESIIWYDAATGGSLTSAPSGIAPGIYTAYAASKITATGCESSSRTLVSVTINALPNSPLAGNVTACFDNLAHTGTATAGAGETVVWFTSAAGGTVTTAPSGTAVGTYTAYAGAKITATGCESSTRTLVTVTINPLPTITLGTLPDFCPKSPTFSIIYLATTEAPTTYSISAGTPAVVGFIPVVNAPMIPSPLIIPLPAAVPAGTYQFIITVKNANGCVSTNKIFNVTIQDIVPPTINCPGNILVGTNTGCTATGVVLGTPIASDNCSSVTITKDKSEPFPVGETIITWTATDEAGLTNTCTQKVTVLDQVDPTALCKNITVNLDAAGNVSIAAADIDNGSNDACGIKSMVASPTSFNCTNIGANTVTLTVTDNSDNISSCTSIVTVADAIPPVAICKPYVLILNVMGAGIITAADVDGGSSDNCSFTRSISKSSFDCSNVGANTVVLTITDQGGNVRTCNASVTVVDNIIPVARCKNVTINLDASGDGTVLASDVDNGSTDNCTIASRTVSPYSFNCANVGNNIVTLTVTDSYGNSSTCTATVVVKDLTPPIAICKNISVNLDNAGSAVITPAMVDNGSNDNCGSVMLSLSKTSFNCTNRGANTVTLTVTDVAGNAATCNATVTVNDVTPPLATCKDFTLTINAATGTGTLLVTDVDNGSFDNCGIVSRTLSKSMFTCIDANGPPQTISLTVTDAAGNISTCSSIVTIKSTLTISSVYLDVCGYLFNSTITGGSSANPNDYDYDWKELSGAKPFRDWLFGGTKNESFVRNPIFNVFLPTGTYNATLTITDRNSLCSVTKSFTFDGSWLPGSTTNFNVNSCFGQSHTYSATKTGTAYSWTYTNGTKISGGGATDNFIQIRWDQVGPSSGTARVDITAPIGFCNSTEISNVTISPLPTPAFSGTYASTVCPQTIQTYTLAANTFSSRSWTVTGATITSGGDAADNSVTVQWGNGASGTVALTVTNANGCSAAATPVTVTITDTQPPVITTCPSAIAVNANTNSCFASGVNLGTPVASDNCGIASITNNAPVSGQYPVGITTVNWTVTDYKGNTQLLACTQTVTVTDNPPTITCPPSPANLTAGSACTAIYTDLVGPGYSDNCILPSNPLTWSMTGATTTSGTGVISNATLNKGITSVTYTVTDVSGKTASCSYNVTVNDITPPSITCPANATAFTNSGCTATGLALGTPITSDNCSVASVTNNAPASFPIGVTTVSWTVTDGAGLTATCNQTVTISDNVLPTISCPANIPTTVTLGACNRSVFTPNPVTADNCSVSKLTWTMTLPDASVVSSPGTGIQYVGTKVFNLGVTTINYTVTDVNSNSALPCSFTVTVADNQAPTLSSCPTPASSYACDSGQTYATLSFTAPTATDNCTTPNVTWSASGTIPAIGAGNINLVRFPIGSYLVTYTATDATENATNCTFTVTVFSNDPPAITCPDAIIQTADQDLCTATINPGTPILVSGTAPVSYGWKMTGATTGIGTGTIGSLAFNLGTTTIEWTASNIAGTSTCFQTVSVTDNQAPTFVVPTLADGYCPIDIFQAKFNNAPYPNDLYYLRPDYYIFGVGSPILDLDLTKIIENCGLAANPIAWAIDFGNNGGLPDLSGNGQLSLYGIPIQFPVGDNKITYTVADAAVSANTTTHTVILTVIPRPVITLSP